MSLDDVPLDDVFLNDGETAVGGLMPQTVRFQVSYETEERALQEIVRNVQRGPVVLHTRKPLREGTRLEFEIFVGGRSPPALVDADVLQTVQEGKDRFRMTLQYSHGASRKGFEALVLRIFEIGKLDGTRKFPRLPLSVRARLAPNTDATSVVKNLSTGGLCIQADEAPFPSSLLPGVPVTVGFDLLGIAPLKGTATWVAGARGDNALGQLGVQFDDRIAAKETVKRLLTHRDIPPPPWTAEVRIG